MRFVALLIIGLLALAAPSRAQQDEAVSAWSRGTHSEIRLVAGGRATDGGYRVGVEIRMKPGFKTYWRMPGDAGIPPSFDWSSSQNVGSVSLRWPAPERFVDAGVTTIGYKDRVIFPVLVRPADAAKPVTVTLNLDYAICDRICIPARGTATLALPDAVETAQSAALNAFRDRVPKLGEPGKNNGFLGLMSAVFVRDGNRKAVEITVSQAQGATVADAFLEGPEGWLFGMPQLVSTDGEVSLLRLPVEDKPKNVVGMVPLALTLTGPAQASEVRFDLDISNPRP